MLRDSFFVLKDRIKIQNDPKLNDIKTSGWGMSVDPISTNAIGQYLPPFIKSSPMDLVHRMIKSPG